MTQLEPIRYKNGSRLGQAAEGAAEAVTGRPLAVGIDTKEFRAKPRADETAGVSLRLGNSGLGKPDTHTAAELAIAVSLGKSFIPSAHLSGRTLETWEKQQLFCVDVDNDGPALSRCGRALSLKSAIARAHAYALPLLISYPSFSAGAEADRYRLVFCLEKPTRDKEKAKRFGAALLAAYPEADPSTVQLNRFFYGTDKEVSLWPMSGECALDLSDMG